MSAELWTLAALSLAATFLLAGLLGRRRGDSARDLRLMLGTGAAFGGIAAALAAWGS
jgi:hypothetical protein